jgi:hypothetical protein
MNTTAILHSVAAVLVLGGLLLAGDLLRIGLLALGAVLFVAGIVVARRDDGDADAG